MSKKKLKLFGHGQLNQRIRFTDFDCSKIIARTTLEVRKVSNGNSGQGKTEQQ